MVVAPCQLLYRGISDLFTMDSGIPEAPRSDQLGTMKIVQDAAVVVDNGVVTAVGAADEIEVAYSAEKTVDLGGRILVPGLIDAHTHPAFVVGRAEEFDWRAAGRSYVEIAEQGGGILSSVEAVREASEEQLAIKVAEHFRRMQQCGTVACEAKSGYGLTVEDELKSLRAIRTAATETGMEVFPTFLGAHTIPQEHHDQPDRWLDILCAEGLPAAKEAGLARAADVFIEDHAFNLKRAERYLLRAKELGFALRVHADQFEALGEWKQRSNFRPSRSTISKLSPIPVCLLLPPPPIPLPACYQRYRTFCARMGTPRRANFCKRESPGSSPPTLIRAPAIPPVCWKLLILPGFACA